MSGVLDFLFNGSAPKNVTSYNNSSTTLPGWYQDYTQGIAAKANTLAAQPYVAYGGARVAGLTPDTMASQQGVRNTQNSWSPYVDRAAGSISEATAPQNSALNTALPFLNASARTAPSVVGNYMNPYTQNAIHGVENEAQRNLSQNLIPQINSGFVGSGGYGSSAQAREIGRALQNTQMDVTNKTSAMLDNQFNSAMGQAQTDLSRYENIGGTAGNLAASTNANNLSGAVDMAQLGKDRAQLGYQDASALSQVGSQNQTQAQANLDVGYGDFQNQRDYQWNQLNRMQSAVQGTSLPQTTTGSSSAPLPGATYSASPISIGTGIAGALGTLLQGNK